MAPVQSRLVLAVGFSALATAATALFVVVGLLWRRESRRPDPDKDEPPDRETLDTSESLVDSLLSESSKLIESLAEEPSSKITDSGLLSESFVSENCSIDFEASRGSFKLEFSKLQSDSNSFCCEYGASPEEISSCSFQDYSTLDEKKAAVEKECTNDNSLSEFLESSFHVAALESSFKEDSDYDKGVTDLTTSVESTTLEDSALNTVSITVGETLIEESGHNKGVINSTSIVSAALEDCITNSVSAAVGESSAQEYSGDIKGVIDLNSVESATLEECQSNSVSIAVSESIVKEDSVNIKEIINSSSVESTVFEDCKSKEIFKEQGVSEVLPAPVEVSGKIVVESSLKKIESKEILPESLKKEECFSENTLLENFKQQEDSKQVTEPAVCKGLDLEVSDKPVTSEEQCKEGRSIESCKKDSVESAEQTVPSSVNTSVVKVEDSKKGSIEALKELGSCELILSEALKKVDVCKKVQVEAIKKDSKEVPSLPEKKREKARKVSVTGINKPHKVEPASVKSLEEVCVKKKMSGEVLCDKERKEGSEKGEVAGLELESMKEGEGRDSANHSPSEVMLASPSISSFSDAHSEGSSDSGKGHSDVATSPSRTPAGGSSLAGEDNIPTVYEFVIPQVIVGRLIGRHGSFLHEVMGASHTNIFIKKHPDSSKLKICAIEGGSQHDIDKALEMIRHKFPLRRYPKVTLERVSFSSEQPHQLRAEDFHLSLVEGVNNDVVLSSLMSAGQFFVQQPSHPSYQCLTSLTQALTQLYSLPEQPQLSSPIKDAICVAPSLGGWYRAQIVAVSEDAAHCDIKFLDYGGYLTVETSSLRQIRGDFMMLPFQAIECGLANIAPANEAWSEESRVFVHNLTFGRLLQIQVSSYTDEGVPLVNLYTTFGPQVIMLNNELVAQGFARFLETTAASE